MLKEIFERALRVSAQRPALTTESRELTYGELDAWSERVAAGLWEQGIRPGDRVALLMGNRIEYPVCDLAIIRIGAVKVPLNEMLSATQVGYMLEHSGASVLIVGPELVAVAREALAEASLTDLMAIQIRGAGVEMLAGSAWLDEVEREPLTEVRELQIEPAAAAAIFYTGGTTGRPKGVRHLQQSLAMNLYAHLIEAEITQDDRLLLTTPLPHAAGLFMQAALLRGAHCYIAPRFEPAAVLDSMAAHRITWTFAVPTMIYRLLDRVQEQPRDTSSLRTVVYGAAPITRDRLSSALGVFGQVFIQLYGQTECPNWGTRLSKADHSLEPGRSHLLDSCGKASIMVDVKVVNDAGAVLQPGGVGEVCLRSPYLLESYFKDPAATVDKFLDGWIRTGDVGSLDEEGYLYLKDRRADMIISGGMNVYSAQVENAIQSCPGVSQVAVVGVPHADWGESVLAVIITRDEGLDERTVLEHCRSRLPRYAQPKSVVFVESLPITAYGKVDKKLLRAPYWEGQSRSIH